MEKLVVRQIIKHIAENHCTAEKGMATNLLEVMNIWTETLMHHIPIDVLYLDYQKGFDTLPHLRLLEQIIGITDEALNWLKVFLQCVQ